jgi:CDP-ribitol ribitolphosphotransferase
MEERPVPARPEPGTALPLACVSWERIQLVLEFDGPVPPLALRAAAGQDRMPPTRQWSDGRRSWARFNVFQGPRQRPLVPGRWVLVGCDDDRPVALHPGPEAQPRDGVVTERILGMPASSYRVRGSLEGDPPELVLEVAIGEAVKRRRRSLRDRAGRAWRAVRRTVWRLAFRVLARIVRRGRPVVLFATRTSPRLTGNLQAVRDRMIERGLDRRYDVVEIVKPRVAGAIPWRSRMRLFVGLARADVIFIDDTFFAVFGLRFGPGVRIVQLWHAAGAFKTVGYSRSAADTVAPLDPFGDAYKNQTHAVVSAEHDVPFYAEAFGMPEARVFPTGIPRMDRFFDPLAKDRALAAAREAIPQIAGHAVWLFAPTYRGERVSDATYDLAALDLEALHRAAARRDAVVLFKMHPFVRERIHPSPALADRLIEVSDVPIDVNDLLFSVDLLITDYSSIVFEYSVLDRPMLFFTPDLGDYGSERDFYVPFETFVPGRIVRTFPELLDAIEREDYEFEKVAPFARRHFAHLDGSSTDRVIDLVLGPGR